MINAIITDFDGTLVDTFEANFHAYCKAFNALGIELTKDKYRECFGFRFDRFMDELGIENDVVKKQIRDLKRDYYPSYFDLLKPNLSLINLIDSFHKMGGKTAIASTATKENLMNVVNHLDISGMFDHIFTGLDVKKGKPDPEIYTKSMNLLNVQPNETLIFEDSQVGIDAAKASGAFVIVVSSLQFDKL